MASTLVSVLQLLDSSKVKERNEGLQQMIDLVDSKKCFTSKQSTFIAESLFSLIDLEKASYSKNEAPATLSRLTTASYIFRRFVTRKPNDLKLKLVDASLEFAQTRFFNAKGEIFLPLAVDFSKVIQAIVAYGAHRDHLSKANWLKLLNMVVRALNFQFTKRTMEKFVPDLIIALNYILKDDTVSANEITDPLSRLICRYFGNLKNEDSSTSLILETSNQALLLASTTNVTHGLKIVKSVIEASAHFIDSNYESSRDQLLIFSMLSSEYIANDIPKLTNEDGMQASYLDTEFRESFLFLLQSLMNNCLKSPENALSIDMISFNNTESINNRSWTDFQTMKLRHSKFIKPWLSHLSLASLLNSFFRFEHNADNADTADISPLSKKRRLDNSLVDVVRHSSSSLNFYDKLLESSDTNIQLLGLKLLVFHVHNLKSDRSEILIEKVHLYNKPLLSEWSSLAIRTLLEFGWKASNDFLTQVFRINLQMLKDQRYVNVASQIIIQIVSTSSFLLSDRLLSQSLQSLFETPEINGPALLTNDSLKFWAAVIHLSKVFSLGEKKISDNIIHWLISKWETSDDDSPIDVLPHFISWLAGSSFVLSVPDDDYSIDDIFVRFYYRWINKLPLARQILKNKIENPIVVKGVHLKIPNLVVNPNSFEPLIDKILESLLQLDDVNTMVNLVQFIGYSLTIYQSIYKIPELLSSAERIKYDVRRLLDNLNPTSSKVRDDVIRQFNRFQIREQSCLFVYDYITRDVFFKNQEVVKQTRNPTGTNEFDGFGAVRKVTETQSFNLSLTYTDFNCAKSPEQQLLLLIINANSNFDLSKPSNSAIDQAVLLLESLPPQEFCFAFYSLLDYFRELDLTHVQTTSIRLLLRNFGTKLLTDYQFQRSAISVALISDFASIFSMNLLSKGCDDLVNDFFDIFEWYLSLAAKGNLSDEHSSALFVKYLFEMLSFKVDSNVFDSSQVTEVALSLFKEGSNTLKVFVTQNLESYLSSLQWNSRNSFLDKIIQSFESCLLTDESSASLLACLKLLSTISYSFLIKSICCITENHYQSHFRHYSKDALDAILMSHGRDSFRKIPDIQVLEIFGHWISKVGLIDKFPFDLLGYSQLDQFINDYKNLLFSLLTATSGVDSERSIKILLSVSGEGPDTLGLNQISMILPLAYSHNGLRGQANKNLIGLFGDKLVEHHFVLAVANFIKLIDVSDESDFFKYIPGSERIPHLKTLISDDSPKLYSRVNVSVSFSDGLHQITKLLRAKEPWPTDVVLFLLKELLADLQDSFSTHENLIVLRKLKLILIIGVYGSESHTDEVLCVLVNVLSTYLVNEALHVDVSKIIVTAIRLYNGNVVESRLYPSGLFQLFYNVSVFKESGFTVDDNIKALVFELYLLVDSKRAWKSLFSPFVDILKDIPIRLTLDLLHQALDYAAQTSRSPELRSHILEVMSLVFSKMPNLGTLPPGFKTSKDVALLLLNSSKTKLSEPISIFISRYLGRYFLETGDELQNERTEFQKTIEDDIVAKSKTFYVFCKELLQRKMESHNLKEVNMINQVLGSLILAYNRDPSEIEPYINFELQLAPFCKFLMPLDDHILDILASEKGDGILPGDIIDDMGATTKLLVEWAQFISVSLLYDISNEVPIAGRLLNYISRFAHISTQVVNHIWLFYVTTFGQNAATRLLHFIHKTTLLATASKIDNEKIKLLLNLCFLVRICARNKMKYFTSIYRKLDLVSLYELSISCGLNKFALLLFEEEFTELNPFKRSLEDHADHLRNIYSGLDDTDLIFGIPVDPSLEYAIRIFNQTENNAAKKIAFNSATFDASFLGDDVSVSRNELLDSLSSNSLNGLSSIVNDFVDPLDRLANAYEWNWKLDKWDLPPVSKPETENQCIYSVLKTIKDKSSKEETQKCCQKLMIHALLDNDHKIPLLKSLCILYNIESVNNISAQELKDNILDTIKCTESWFKFAEFDSIENLLLSRKVHFENLGQYIGDCESLLSTAHEIARYGNLSRMHNEKQRSANAALLLSKIVKRVEDEGIKAILSKVSNFEAASTLWSQGETTIPIAMLEKILNQTVSYENKSFPLSLVQPSSSTLNSYLMKWSSQSRQKRFENIMENYVEAAVCYIEDVNIPKKRAEIFHSIAYFCYKQSKRPGAEEELKKRETLLLSRKSELKELKTILINPKTNDRDKKEAKRCYQKISLQFSSDKEAYEAVLANSKLCVEKAIEFFLKTISVHDDYDEEDIDKLCAMWLQYSDAEFVNSVVQRNITNVPSHKFIPWINQLVSRLSNDTSTYSSPSFQQILQELLLDICFVHPYHSLYYMQNLELQKNYEISISDKAVTSRIDAVTNILNKLKQKSAYYTNNVLLPVDSLAKSAMDLANFKIPKTGKREIQLENLEIGTFWIKVLPSLNIPLPTMNHIPVSYTGDYDSIPRITSVQPRVSISASGISLPKIVKVLLNDGSTHRLLLKGGTDDLRQDAIMTQVFEKVNIILQNDKMTRKRNLRIRTYKVVPLGPTSGMIEFVADSIALSDILRPLHKDDKLSFEDARLAMKEAQSKNTRDRLSTYLKICKSIDPAFRFFFYDTFLNVDGWYKSRQIYTKGIVTTSLVGHILGIGDRHLNNILIDKKSGEPIHIDFGVAFDQGKLLPIPENVPFRLTRDLVDGLGVTGVKGSFEKSSEHVYRVLRDNAERIISILEVLKYDPLYSWAISPIRKRKLQDMDDSSRSSVESDDSDAGRAVKGVEEKLTGNGLNVDATVQQLIQEATDAANLATIYLGWSPFY